MFTSVNRKDTYTTKYDGAIQKFGTKDVLPLWVADMDLASPQCVHDALTKRATHQIYGYTVYPSRYYDAIAHWMEKRFLWSIEKEWIVPCYGVVPSINFAITAYSNEGDGILVQTPLYPPFVSSIKHKNRKVLDNILMYKEGAYSIDFFDFEEKAKEAKLFLLCSPHNPTSRAWNKEELEHMIAICLKHDVLIIADEIHGDVVYQKLHYSIGSFEKMEKQCIIFNAPSKTFNIAGLNTSYAVIPDFTLRQKFMLEQNKSGITNGNPFGIEALMAAYEKGDVWLEDLKIHLQKNITYVNDFLKTHNIPIQPTATEATFLMWLDCRNLGFNHKELTDFFYTKAKLGLNDGESFGKAGHGFMRLNIGTGRDVLEVAMSQLLTAYKNLA